MLQTDNGTAVLQTAKSKYEPVASTCCCLDASAAAKIEPAARTLTLFGATMEAAGAAASLVSREEQQVKAAQQAKQQKKGETGQEEAEQALSAVLQAANGSKRALKITLAMPCLS